ncbi:MAG TPA: hypothetical protein VJU61_23665 [Polyangiaceae bacterium]|nr:hypothetical protein [Polyangiaceae bacterium]
MEASKRKRPAAVLMVIAIGVAAQAALATPGVEEIVLTGTVTSIFQVIAPPGSDRHWGATLRVEKVKAGVYSEPTFTFTLHSPARSGVDVGGRCTIVATKAGEKGHFVYDTRQIDCER